MPFILLATINNKGGGGNDNAFIMFIDNIIYNSACKYSNTNECRFGPGYEYSILAIS